MFFSNSPTKRNIINNALWRSSSLVINKIIRLVVVFFAAKSLGPSEFGYYNYVVALTGIFFIFSDWGINILMARGINQEGGSKNIVVNSALAIKLLLIFAPALIGIFYFLFWSPDHFLLGLITIGMLFVGAIREIFNNYFIAIQRSVYEFLVYAAEDLVLIFLIFYTIFFNLSAVGLGFWYLVATVLTSIIGYVLTKSDLSLSWTFVRTKEIKIFFRDGLPLSLFGVLGYIFFSTDQLFINHYFGYTEVGYYAFAAKLVLVFSVVPSLLNSVLFPYIVKNHSDTEKIKRMLYKVVFLYAGTAGVISLFINLISKVAVSYFFGEQYFSAVGLLNVFSFILIFIFSVSILDYILIAYNQQKNDFILTFCAAIINLILNFIFVPRYGSMGAIGASIFSQAINFVLTLFLVLYILKRKRIYVPTQI